MNINLEKSMNVVSNFYNWLNKDKNLNCLNELSENQILNIANDINSIFSDTNLVDKKPTLTLPKLITVGTQSSGKSSVLNSIIGMDILPTGKNMVTRSPLDIRLHKIENSNGWIEFGHYDITWVCDKKINITVPLPTSYEIDQIRNYIEKRTIEIAGEGMNITDEPIILNIYSPSVPNLSLTDLPGLTMVAQVDKGQPQDIKKRIEDLIVSHIKKPRTIMIAVMQSRPDLETDLGLALIKEHDPDGKRTIGVLTKPDLMNYDTHIGDYLIGNISKNLMLNYGYYVVKNRSGKEMESTNIIKGFEIEKNYFQSHQEYKKQIYKNNIGMGNLTFILSKILISSISELIPSVLAELTLLETKISKKLDILGQSIPETSDGKISILNKYVSSFFYQLVDSLKSEGHQINTGKILKDLFIKYREAIENIEIFDNEEIYNDDYFKKIISSFEGNHMSFHIPPIQVLEACMLDINHRPILSLSDPSYICIENISNTLTDLVKEIIKQEEFSKFPQLASFLQSIINENLIISLKTNAKNRINSLIRDEESYIWTDDEEFSDFLKKTNSNNYDNKKIINLLDLYFTTIKNTFANLVPKIIMSEIVTYIQNNLLTYMMKYIVNETNFNLLKEDNDVYEKRTYYSNLQKRILSIRSKTQN